jgi:hypothetical protein
MKKLYLTKNNSKILGICGSIGETGACPIRQAQGKL